MTARTTTSHTTTSHTTASSATASAAARRTLAPAGVWWRRAGRGRRAGRRFGDRGQVSAFAVIIVTAMIALAGLVLDGGMAVVAKADAFGLAQSAARAGAQQLDLAYYRTTGVVRLDPDRARAAATAWLDAAGATGTVTATPTQVQVRVDSAAPTQLLVLVGVTSIPVHATATAVAVQAPTG